MIQSVVLASAAAGVLTAAAVIGITGLLIAVLLGVAANVFEVPVDEKAIAIRDVLPGANCGGCGYAGCDAMAAAIAAGEAPVNGCPVGGPAVADKIGEIMGVSAGEDVKKVAFVKCAGTCDKASVKANYYGISDCRSAAAIPFRSQQFVTLDISQALNDLFCRLFERDKRLFACLFEVFLLIEQSLSTNKRHLKVAIRMLADALHGFLEGCRHKHAVIVKNNLHARFLKSARILQHSGRRLTERAFSSRRTLPQKA